MGLGTAAAPRDIGEMPNTPALGHRILHQGHCTAELPQANPKLAQGSWACSRTGDGTAGGSPAANSLPSFRVKKGKSKAFLKDFPAF